MTVWNVLLAFCSLSLSAVASPAQEETTGERGAAAQARLRDVLLERERRSAERTEALFDRGRVVGRIEKRSTGSYFFSPSEEENRRIPITNPEAVTTFAVGPLLDLTGVLTETGSLTVQDIEVTFDAGRTRDATSLEPRASEIDRALGRVSDVLSSLVDPDRAGAMRVVSLDRGDNSESSREIRAAEERLVEIYAEAAERGDERLRRESREAYRDLEHELKAIYGEYSNYPPWSYQTIFENSRAAVALGLPAANTAICSGVLVSDDLVLTAGHCFENHEPEELEIWFGYADSASQRANSATVERRSIDRVVAPTGERLNRLLAQKFGPDLYDYAIVRFKPGEDGSLIPSCKDEKRFDSVIEPPGPRLTELLEPEIGPGLGNAALVRLDTAPCARPQCLLPNNVGQGRPLYVIGYPRGFSEQVHDEARVYLPFRLSERKFNEVKLTIENDLAMLVDNPEEKLEEFVESYVPVENNRWELYHRRYSSQPAIGIVADTFKGNSGSPVYDRDRREHCVLGILIGGAKDTSVRLAASWVNHEMVLPMLKIVEDLKAHDDTRFLAENVLQID